MRTRVSLALLVPLAAAVVASASWWRRPAGCPPATLLQAGPAPTESEILRLVGDAEQRLAAAGARANLPALKARISQLRSAIRDGSRNGECRALAKARAELRALPDSPVTAPQRNAMALALDLTAAFVAQGDATQKRSPTEGVAP